jgi:hypothetical protein
LVLVKLLPQGCDICLLALRGFEVLVTQSQDVEDLLNIHFLQTEDRDLHNLPTQTHIFLSNKREETNQVFKFPYIVKFTKVRQKSYFLATFHLLYSTFLQEKLLLHSLLNVQ